MAELRYYVAPMAVGPVYGGTDVLRTHPFFRSRLNPTGPPVEHISMMPLGKRDLGLLAVTAEPLEHDAFVAAGGGVELPHRRNMRLADMSRLRDVVPLALIDSRITSRTPGWQAVRYLGRTAQFLQRIHGQFGGDVLDADRTRFAELGDRYAALKDEPDFRTRLEGAVDAWPELLALRLGVGIDLGFDPAQPLPEAGDALPASDAFTNTNNTFLSAHNALWVSPDGTTEHDIQSNAAEVPFNSAQRFMRWNETWNNDQKVGCRAVNTANYTQGPAARIQTSARSCYHWQIEPSSGVYLTDYAAGSGTDLDTYVTFAGTPMDLEIQAEGTTLRGYTGSPLTLRVTVTDSTWASGYGGLGGYAAGAGGPQMDDWYGDNLGGGGAAAFNHHGRPYGQAGFNQMRQLLAR